MGKSLLAKLRLNLHVKAGCDTNKIKIKLSLLVGKRLHEPSGFGFDLVNEVHKKMVEEFPP